MASTTYQDIHPESIQVQELVVFLTRLDEAKGNERMTDYKQLVSSNQFSACMNKLATESDLLFAKANDTDLVSFFALFSTLLLKLGKDLVEDLLPKVITRIASSTERKQVRLQILADIFNLDANNTHRIKVLNAIFRYAAESEQVDAVQHHLTSLDDWVFELKLDDSQTRSLIGSILPGLQNSADSRDLFVRYLSTFSETANLTSSEEEIIKKSLIEFMKVPSADTVELDEIFESPILSVLKGTAVYELLEIFATGNIKQFKDFASKNETFLSESGMFKLILGIDLAGIDSALAAHFVSLSAFARLCTNKKVITYAEVASALQISEDEVEPVAVDSVMQGLVDVRLDQPEKIVLVKYAKQRSYEQPEWTKLGQRVDAFKNNILDLIKVLEEANESA